MQTHTAAVSLRTLSTVTLLQRRGGCVLGLMPSARVVWSGMLIQMMSGSCIPLGCARRVWRLGWWQECSEHLGDAQGAGAAWPCGRWVWGQVGTWWADGPKLAEDVPVVSPGSRTKSLLQHRRSLFPLPVHVAAGMYNLFLADSCAQINQEAQTCGSGTCG